MTPYDLITKLILDKIKAGDLVWRKSWSAGPSGTEAAKNYISKKAYRGINALILNLVLPGKSSYWLTFNQIKKLKGNLKKGAKARPVFYYNFQYILKETGARISEARADLLPESDYITIPFLRYYSVFNTSDVENVKFKTPKKAPRNPKVDPIESALDIVSGMPLKPKLGWGGDRAYYAPGTDQVQMPHLDDFDNPQAYYSTLFHELVHSTGHKKRLDRDLTGTFGSKSYAFEELIAEFGASFLCGEAGILYFTLDNTAAYIKSWSKKLTTILEEDNKFVLRATAAAQKAADFIQASNKGGTAPKDRKPIKRTPKAKESKKEQSLSGITAPANYVPVPTAGIEIDESTPFSQVLSELPTMATVKENKSPVKKFNFNGDFGKFLGPISIEPDSSVVAAITAEKGTGKSHALFQAMEAIAGSGYPILFGSYEEFTSSSLFTEKIDKYISEKNKPMITTVDQRIVPTAEEFLKHAQNYPVVVLDSAQEIPGEVEVQALREGIAGTGKLFIIVFHATTEGKMKGGTSPQHRADIIIVGEKHEDFRLNYLHYGKDGKNRYQPEQGLKYSIYKQKLIQNEESDDI